MSRIEYVQRSRDAQYGLQQIGNHLFQIQNNRKMLCRPEFSKLNVLVIGNHSVGKSSYINWYIGEQLLKEGIAMQTKTIQIITSGKNYNKLAGHSTRKLFPIFSNLIDPISKKEIIPGLLENLITRVCPSKHHSFPYVNFIDTPGLTDGDLRYAFDIDKSIIWLAQNVADVIMVFFDPIGQTLCNRTMNIISKLDVTCHHKLNYFLSKGDLIESPNDRQKVMVQISQGLASVLQPSHALEIPLIYLPKREYMQSNDDKIGGVKRSKTQKFSNKHVYDPQNNIEETCTMILQHANVKAERCLRKMKEDIIILQQGVQLQECLYHYITFRSLKQNDQAVDSFTWKRDTARILKAVFWMLMVIIFWLLIIQIFNLSFISQILFAKNEKQIINQFIQTCLNINERISQVFFDSFILFFSISFVILMTYNRFIVKRWQRKVIVLKRKTLSAQQSKLLNNYLEYLQESMVYYRKWVKRLVDISQIDNLQVSRESSFLEKL